MAGITTLFGDSPRMIIMEFFMQFPKDMFTVPELVEGIGMSRTTAFREIKQLLQDGMIMETDKIGKSPTYMNNLKNPVVKTMQRINSYKSKQVAISQLKNLKLHQYTKKLMIVMDRNDLKLKHEMLENELKSVKQTLKEIPA